MGNSCIIKIDESPNSSSQGPNSPIRLKVNKKRKGFLNWNHNLVKVRTNSGTIKIVTNGKKIRKENEKFVKRFRIEESMDELRGSDNESDDTKTGSFDHHSV